MINVILPTYNEAGCIAITIRMLKDTLENLKVPYLLIIVDDASPDNTSEIVKGLGYDNVKVIDRPMKLGLGSAYMDGLRYCTHPYTVIMDTDLQHDPFAIADMYRMTNGNYDIISGTRYAKHGMVCHWPFQRRLISCVANNIARYTLGLRTLDLTGSFRMYKTSVLRQLMPEIKCKSFGFQMEIMARAERMGFSVAECPIVFYTRKTGESKISGREILLFLMAILRLYLSIK